MMSRFFPLLLLLLSGLLAIPAARAQGAPLGISASLSARALGPGQQVVLSYQINGSQRGVEDFPRTIEVPGLTITFSGQSQRTIVSRGVPSVEISIRYVVQSGEAGEFEIPAQTFKVDGMELQAAVVKVSVKEGQAVDEELTPTIQLAVGKTEFWKGEVVPVRVSVLVHPTVQPLSQFFPQVKTPNFAVNRFDRSAGLEARELNGEVWRAWQMESVLTALQAGAQTFGPAEIKAELLMPTAGGFNAPFGQQQGDRRTVALSSNTVPVNVKELPLEGKPADFSGAVGEFEVELLASPVSLNAGDPIAVEIAISGTGSFDALTAPRIESSEGWRLYEPRVSQENRAWGTEPGRKSFTQILIPEKNHTQIPSFVLHYFDPQSGTYVTRKSPPVLITVKGEFKPALNPAADARDFAAPIDASAPTEELGDILDQPLMGGEWLATAVAPIPVNRTLFHGVPALLLVLLVGQGIRRRFQAAAAARQPRPGAPREPYAVLTDLRRLGTGRRTFYAFVNEYLTSLAYHQNRQPMAGPERTAVLEARDRWLYGPDEAAAREALPADEQRHTLEVLCRL
jgi:hypothetical protein